MTNFSSQWLEQLHRAWQFLGNTYFQLGEVENKKEEDDVEIAKAAGVIASEAVDVSDKRKALKEAEDAAYADAEKVRQDLLAETKEQVTAAQDGFANHESMVDGKEWIIDAAFSERGGLASQQHFDRLQSLADVSSGAVFSEN